uniref:Uncharacterized protein n=1 Tax=Rhizophora mucronata TaxID=61149 RepID=A0A2P2PXM0_RHIMU
MRKQSEHEKTKTDLSLYTSTITHIITRIFSATRISSHETAN